MITPPLDCAECSDEMKRLAAIGCTNLSCNKVDGQDGMCAISFDPPGAAGLQRMARSLEQMLVVPLSRSAGSAGTRPATLAAPAPHSATAPSAAALAGHPADPASAGETSVPLGGFSQQLQARVVAGAPGLQGFDCNAVLSPQNVQQALSQGFRFCIRYISRTDPHAGDLTSDEARMILSAGLALMPVQHVDQEGWVPSLALGQQNGAHAATNAGRIGFPAGVNVWLDLEGVNPKTPKSDVIDYCNAWFDALRAAGFEPGIYVGANCQIAAEDLYWRLKTIHYWKSGSRVPAVPVRGYQMIQKIIAGDRIGNIAIDRNVTQDDGFDGCVQWLAAA